MSNLFKAPLCAAAIGGLLICTPAFAHDYPDGGITANEFASELVAIGQKAKISKGSDGDPVIDATFTIGTTDIDYRIFFYGCKQDRCSSVQYHVAFDGKPDKAISWNKENRFARAYASGTTVHLEYDVDLEKGANSAAIQNTASRWIALMVSGVSYAG